MIAGPKTMERMVDRLRRWGLMPRLRGGQVFICEPQKMLLDLGGFFAIVELDTEVRIASKDQPITTVLNNRKNRWEDGWERYQRHIDNQSKDAEYESEQSGGQLEEVLRDMDKIQVQVP